MSMQIKKLEADKAAQIVKENQLKLEKNAKRKELQTKRTKKSRSSIAKTTATTVGKAKKQTLTTSSTIQKKSVGFKASAMQDATKSIKPAISNESTSKQVPKITKKSRLAGGGLAAAIVAETVAKVATRRTQRKKTTNPSQEDKSQTSVTTAKIKTATVAGQPADLEKPQTVRKRKISEQTIEALPNKSLRQTTRLSSDITTKKTNSKLQSAVVKAVFSPPITRSRLKQLTAAQQPEIPKKVALTAKAKKSTK